MQAVPDTSHISLLKGSLDESPASCRILLVVLTTQDLEYDWAAYCKFTLYFVFLTFFRTLTLDVHCTGLAYDQGDTIHHCSLSQTSVSTVFFGVPLCSVKFCLDPCTCISFYSPPSFLPLRPLPAFPALPLLLPLRPLPAPLFLPPHPTFAPFSPLFLPSSHSSSFNVWFYRG